jgi:hypothetical protein
MNRFRGRFASGMKRELAVGDSPAWFGSSGLGDSPARFGFGGGRFTTLARSQSPFHTHSNLLAISLSHSLSLAHSHPLTLTCGLGHAARS